MATHTSFRSSSLAILGLISLVISMLGVGAAEADVTHVRPSHRDQGPTGPGTLTAGGLRSAGFVGPGAQGEVLFGYSADSVPFPDRLWAIGLDGTVLRRIASGERFLQEADTGGGQTWGAGSSGLYRVEDAGLVPVHYIRIDRDPGSGRLLIATAFKGGETAGLRCRSVVVDAKGRPWVDLPWFGGELWGFVPPASGTDGVWGTNYAAVRLGGAPIVAAPSPVRGVWVYAIRNNTAVLEHLDATGHGREACIVTVESAGEGQLPGLAAPRMAVSPEAGVVVIGQAADDDQMIRYRDGEVTTASLPPDLFHSRHVTALDVDSAGRIYAATDGVGVMVLDETGWQPHPITDHLPTIAGTDLKPVDDILVTEDGTVYAACQTNLVIWRPDGEEE